MGINLHFNWIYNTSLICYVISCGYFCPSYTIGQCKFVYKSDVDHLIMCVHNQAIGEPYNYKVFGSNKMKNKKKQHHNVVETVPKYNWSS